MATAQPSSHSLVLSDWGIAAALSMAFCAHWRALDKRAVGSEGGSYGVEGVRWSSSEVARLFRRTTLWQSDFEIKEMAWR